MTKKLDYVALFGPDGPARAYFRKAADNGAWVESFCDGLCDELLSRQTVRGTPDTISDLLTALPELEQITGATVYRSEDKWQASYLFDGYTANVTVRYNIVDAVTTMLYLARERFGLQQTKDNG